MIAHEVFFLLACHSGDDKKCLEKNSGSSTSIPSANNKIPYTVQAMGEMAHSKIVTPAGKA